MTTSDAFIPFSRPDVREEDIAAVERVMRSGWLTSGPETHAFEAAFADYVGARHAVAVNSCTAALHLALAAVGIRHGDLVACPTYTFAATAEVIQYMGAVPVLVDSCMDDLNIDPIQLEHMVQCLQATDRDAELEAAVHDGILAPGTARALAGRDGALKAIIPVHIAGSACDMDRISALGRDRGAAVIEDAAHALETTHNGRKIGTIGDVTAFSFYATKNLATGEGGMATTNDDALAASIRQLSLHGISRDAWKRYTSAGSWRYDIETVGYKYNLTDIAAALGMSQLTRIDASHARRAQIASMYAEGLADIPGVELPRDSEAGAHGWHLYIIRIDSEVCGVQRDDVIERLKNVGVGTSVHFIPLHLHTFYNTHFGYRPGDFPIAERASEQVISIPLYPSMTDVEVERVIDAVARTTRA